MIKFKKGDYIFKIDTRDGDFVVGYIKKIEIDNGFYKAYIEKIMGDYNYDDEYVLIPPSSNENIYQFRKLSKDEVMVMKI